MCLKLAVCETKSSLLRVSVESGCELECPCLCSLGTPGARTGSAAHTGAVGAWTENELVEVLPGSHLEYLGKKPVFVGIQSSGVISSQVRLEPNPVSDLNPASFPPPIGACESVMYVV